jgi:hypothetical protein
MNEMPVLLNARKPYLLPFGKKIRLSIIHFSFY